MSPIIPAIVVHGGAGLFAREHHEPARAGCLAAAQAGLQALAEGGSAMDAAIASVHVLEDLPVFNAGVGAVLTRAETVEMDASVMDGADLRFGAVAAMPNCRHPIDVARALMDHGDHVLLSGAGAWEFAREYGFTPADPAELITESSLARVRKEARRRHQGATPEIDPGTVGACAIDANGHVATVTSTGGTNYKRIGRIGDTPLCGAGTYADDRGGAASATGYGEAIIRVTMTRVCVDAMRTGETATEAAWRAVTTLAEDVRGRGGIICCDRAGRVGAAHNTPYMPHAAGRIVDGARRVIAGLKLQRDADIDAALT